MNPTNLYKSFFLELAAVTSIIISQKYYAIFTFFIFHFMASFLISQIIVALLPKNYKKNLLANTFFFTILNTVTLFVGYIASFYFVTVLLRKIKTKIKYDINTINISQLSIFPETRRILGEGIANIDISKISKNIKLNILETLSKDISPINIRIIKNLLIDNDSEIRLYSFQTLNRIKNEISSQINLTLKELEKPQDNFEKAKIHKKLGLLYYEIFEIDIMEESLRSFFIEKSLFHIKEAEKIIGDGELLYIRGMIFKAKKEYEKALRLFDLSLRFRFDEHKVLPQIAEIYYEKKEYDKVKEIFKRDYTLKIDLNTYMYYQIWAED